jgi:hypothetical protein
LYAFHLSLYISKKMLFIYTEVCIVIILSSRTWKKNQILAELIDGQVKSACDWSYHRRSRICDATATPSSKSCNFARIPCTALIRPARYTQSLFSSKKWTQKVLQYLSHQILRHMHRVLNVDERKKLITQFNCKSRDKSFEPN